MRYLMAILISLFITINWANAQVDLSNTYQASITPTDTAATKFEVPTSSGNEQPTKAIYVGTGGTLIVVKNDGTEITFTNVPDASLLPINCVRVKSTGTTATGLVGYF